MKLLVSLHHIPVLLMPSVAGEEKSSIISSSSRLPCLLHRGGMALSCLPVCAHVMTCWRMSQTNSVHICLGAAKSYPWGSHRGSELPVSRWLTASSCLCFSNQCSTVSQKTMQPISLKREFSIIYAVFFMLCLSCRRSLDIFFIKLSF